MEAIGEEVTVLSAPIPPADREVEAVNLIADQNLEPGENDSAEDSSSMSIIYEPDYVVLNPTKHNPFDSWPQRTDDTTLRLNPMETVSLRRIDTRPPATAEYPSASRPGHLQDL